VTVNSSFFVHVELAFTIHFSNEPSKNLIQNIKCYRRTDLDMKKIVNLFMGSEMSKLSREMQKSRFKSEKMLVKAFFSSLALK
jgi:hypothetical protein